MVTIGEVQGSKPTMWVSPEKDTHDRHLNCDDIEGAKPTSFGVGNIQRARASPKNPNEIGDIEGSMAGTRKKNFTSLRSTNPLDPTYQLPGHSEEPEIPESKTPEQKKITDHAMSKNVARFYGATPTPSLASSRSRSSVHSKSASQFPVARNVEDMMRKDSFRANAKRFFHTGESQCPTPASEQRRLDRNAVEFYAGVKHPLGFKPNIPQTGSIHRQPKAQVPINTTSKEFNRNVDQFYGHQQSPHTYEQSNGVSLNVGQRPPSELRMDPEFTANANKFFSNSREMTPQTSQAAFNRNAAKFYENPTPPSSNYRFNLGRGAINQPVRPAMDLATKEFNRNQSKFFGATPPASNASSRFRDNTERFFNNQ